jgi:hypothetical protein
MHPRPRPFASLARGEKRQHAVALDLGADDGADVDLRRIELRLEVWIGDDGRLELGDIRLAGGDGLSKGLRVVLLHRLDADDGNRRIVLQMGNRIEDRLGRLQGVQDVLRAAGIGTGDRRRGQYKRRKSGDHELAHDRFLSSSRADFSPRALNNACGLRHGALQIGRHRGIQMAA